MKKWLKIIFWFIGIIITTIVIDLVFIFTINRPIFSQVEDYGAHSIYKGIFFNTYNCPEYSVPQIKAKWDKFTCAMGRVDIGKVIKLEDKTKKIKDFTCDLALEKFYEDDMYKYSWSCIKNDYMVVKYESGFEETISNGLKYGSITINDLDKFDIDYIKEENAITLNDVNIKIQEYFGRETIDRNNLGYNYVDEKNEVVVVGLIDNSPEKQDEFLYNVFSSCCGSTYIKYLKSKSMIKFVKIDPITTSNDN